MIRTRDKRLLALFAAAALAGVFGLSGCGNGQQYAESAPSESTKSMSSSTGSLGQQAVNGSSFAGDGAAPLHVAARQPGAERAVMRQAALGVDVANLDKAEKAMKESVTVHGGYIDHLEGTDLASDQPTLHVTLRVPEKSFEDVLSGFEALGRRTDKAIWASDVTEQILDAEAQLQQLKRERDETIKSSGKLVPSDYMSDRIKEVQAQKDALAMRASMATIDLTLHQKPNVDLASAASASWGSDTFNAAMSSALGALRVIGAGLIWLLAYSPMWGILVFAGLWMRRSIKRAGPRPTMAGQLLDSRREVGF